MKNNSSVLVLVCCFWLLAGQLSAEVKKPPITPRWAFGHIVWEDSLNTQQAALKLVEGYQQRNIPVSGIIIDSPWSTAYNNFNWNPERYPDPQAMIKTLNGSQVRTILWLTGCINLTAKDMKQQKHELYDWVIEKRYVINQGKPSTWWKGNGLHLDFTNPEAVTWWNAQLDKVFTDGIYGWKTDQGEIYFGDTVETSIGKLTNEQFRPYYYNSMFEYTTAKNQHAGIIIGRPFSHQGGIEADVTELSLGWCGDFAGNWAGLRHQITNIYKSAELGYGALACEVAGFWRERSSKTELIRYCQFGAMTASMINGGENGAFTNHLPWYHDAETERIYRYYTTLHQELIPYLFSTVVDAHLNGGSLIRQVSCEQESHRLGSNLFTKAITSYEGQVTFSLPADADWFDFKTGMPYAKGTAVTIDIPSYPLDEYPVFVRAGAVIPMDINSSVTGIGDETFKGSQTILIYLCGQTSYLYHKPLGEGTAYEDVSITLDEKAGTVMLDSSNSDTYIFLLKNQSKPLSVTGADSWTYNAATHTLQLRKTGSQFIITLK